MRIRLARAETVRSISMKQVTVTIPATSANLGPGFDCLGLALGLYNQVTFTRQGGGLRITVEGEGAATIPRDERNLVYRAAARLFSEADVPVPGLHIHQVNRIPVSSGLGSSAAAVLGGIMAAGAFLPAPPNQPEILRLATRIEGHPDNITPAMLGGLTLIVQEAGELYVERIDIPAFLVIVVLPEFDFPTSTARSVLPAHISRQDAIFNASRLALLIRALQSGDIAALRLAMQDRLHQPYRLPMIPGMAEAFAAVQGAGAAVALSGAGPSLLAIAPDNYVEIAHLAADAFAAAGLKARTWVLPVDARGSVVQTQGGGR